MTDSLYVLAGIVIIILAIVGGIAATIVRSRSKNLWAHLVATEDGTLSVQDRLDMVARLEIVGETWCIDALQSATHEEQDPQVNAAVRAALERFV